LTCSGIDALPSFSGMSTISSSSGFVVEGMFRKSGVVHSSKMVNPVLFVFGSHVCDLQLQQNMLSSFVCVCVWTDEGDAQNLRRWKCLQGRFHSFLQDIAQCDGSCPSNGMNL
jgi:hypothetical protein